MFSSNLIFGSLAEDSPILPYSPPALTTGCSLFRILIGFDGLTNCSGRELLSNPSVYLIFFSLILYFYFSVSVNGFYEVYNGFGAGRSDCFIRPLLANYSVPLPPAFIFC